MFGRKKGKTSADLMTYEARNFTTSDARQLAFDDDFVIPVSQSGLAGLVPLFGMLAVQVPNGFDYMTNLIGLGGTPAPVSVRTPLVNQPQFSAIFLSEFTGQDTGLGPTPNNPNLW